MIQAIEPPATLEELQAAKDLAEDALGFWRFIKFLIDSHPGAIQEGEHYRSECGYVIRIFFDRLYDVYEQRCRMHGGFLMEKERVREIMWSTPQYSGEGFFTRLNGLSSVGVTTYQFSLQAPALFEQYGGPQA